VKIKRVLPPVKAVKKSRPSAVAQALEQRILFSADVAAIALLPTAAEPAAQVQSQLSVAANASANSTTQTPAKSQLFVLDLRIADAQSLLVGLEQQQAQARVRGEIFEILTLDWQDDGIAKIGDVLKAQGNVSALHLIGHGDDGMMLLGSTWLDQATLRTRATDFSAWSNGFTPEADILIYGCDFAVNQTGQQSVRSLAQITGADVAASIDSTSNISQGGNWVLEYLQGAIEATTSQAEEAAAQWQGKLATFVVTNNSNSGAGSLRQAITDANNIIGSDVITFNIGGAGVKTIGLLSALPQITEGVLIDGGTQSGYALGAPLIVLNGTNAGVADGISISSSTPVTIRGLVINRFQGSGITIFGGGSNILTGNFIGIDETGNNALSNGGDGIYVYNSSNNIIGGTTAAERNIVSANSRTGVEIDSGSNGNIVQGNFVGTNATGTVPLGNTLDGIVIGASSNAMIGGTATGAGNLVSGNLQNGIGLYTSGGNNTILGNVIGLNAQATAAIANGQSGIAINASNINTIGSTAVGGRNIVSGNTGSGIYLNNTNGNTIVANWIGRDGSNSATIGNGIGVMVEASAVANAILGNSISGNVGLDIDLAADGVTANDLNDTDSGANGLQNYPAITSVTSTGGNTTILGGFNSSPNQTFRIEYFSSPSANLTGFGGGKTFIGFTTLTTGADGNANINSVLTGISVPIGHVVSATATQDLGGTYGGTSEFAKSVAVNSVFPGVVIGPLSGTVTSESGTSVTFTIRLSTAPTGTVTIPISSDKFWEGDVNVPTLTFTTANWNIDQIVTVTGVDDSVIDGSHNYNVVFGDAVSSDPAYNLMMLPPIAVSNIDNDSVSIVVVNTTADIADGDTSSMYALIRNLGADGKISLREAILAANNTPNGFGGADQIQFNISEALVNGEHVITLTSALPTITEALIIDGSTEPDWTINASRPVVVINGNDIVAPIIHLNMAADNCAIIGLIIRNSASEGILIDAGSNNNTIIGNYIGSLRSDGLSAGASFGNVNGVSINGAGNVIGGVNISDRNVISGNSFGVVIAGAAGMSNFIVGNYIGTTATGNTAPGNTYDGVQIQSGATSNTIGGDTAAHRNIISGNLEEGIEINGEATDNNIVRGNYIGVSADGLSNLTPATNLGTGIYIFGGADTTLVGGSIAGQGNWIAGLHYGGVVIDGVSTGTVIQGNRIGTDATGLLNWGTGFNAILIENGAGSTLVGGTSALSSNILTNSGQISPLWTAGLTIIGTGINNAVLGNTIYGNVGVGIDLGNNGVTTNDVGDIDDGVNGFQNYPILGTSLSTGANTTITGSLNSNANKSYRIEFFSSPTGDTSGNGEALTYLGFVNVTTNASGNASFSTTLVGVSVAAGNKITSTATVDLGNGNFGSTSEFSANVNAGAGLNISGTVYEDINSNGQVADDGVGLAGAIVSLYHDNGDGVIGAGDTIVGNIGANASGQYSFNNVASGTYWVVVDSRTFRSNSGLTATSTILDQWAEQTYGSAGSVAWNGASYTYSASNGTFLGGMRNDRSDNGASLPTAEHVTRVTVASTSISNVDYGFSYNVITNARDGDDSLPNNLTIQGSLRQFVQNSNALLGVQSSQFRIPAADPNVASGVAVISLTSALPTLNDSIVIDGTTQTNWGGNTNAAVLGTGGNVGYNPVALSQLQAPEVEIRDLTSSPNIFKILGNNSTIRGLALLGGGIANSVVNAAIEVSANNVTIANNIIGSSATAITDPGASNRIQSIGVRVLGQATVDNNTFAYLPMHAVSVEAGGSNSYITNNEFVSPARTANNQAAIAVRDVANIQINGNLVSNSGGNAVELYSNANSNFIRNNSFINGGILPGGDDNAIDITGGSDNNTIEGNLISGNVGAGISIANSADNKIGGTLLTQSNQIVNNGGAGVVLTTTALGNQSILRNSIYNNGGLAIDLGNDGVTQNDLAPDADVGPNNLQNFPSLSSVQSSGGNTTFIGALSSRANTTFRIEFYSSTTSDPSGYGEGQTFLGFTTVVTDSTGNASFNTLLPGLSLAANTHISATATVDLGAGLYSDSSEFSANVQSTVLTPGITLTRLAGVSTTESGGSITFSVVLDTPPTANVVIPLSVTNPFEASLSTNSLSFTTANWNIAQVVTVTGVNDNIVDGNQVFQVIRGVSQSADVSYNAIAKTSFNSTNIDTTSQNTIVVTTTNDIDDGNTSSLAALFLNNGADGRISLREAIIAANNTANGIGGVDKIYFNIADPLIGGAHTINLMSALPTIRDAVIIDGTSEPDYVANRIVELNGANAGNASGLVISASNSQINGLTINRFNVDGIQVTGANNVITNNTIGADITGMTASANLRDGILLMNADNTVIGGSQALGNIIAGNGNVGIEVAGTIGSANVTIQNNLIGVNALASGSIGNGNDNIWIVGAGSTNFTIGGGGGLGGNIIGGSASRGILVSPNVVGGEISFNAIGTNYAATANLGNSSFGALVHGTNINIISNFIANNIGAGLYLNSSASNVNINSNTISNETIGVAVAGTANGVTISQNTMDAVTQLIDLGADGSTANDLGDIDSGPNGFQNTPLISSVSTDGFGQISVVGSYNGLANRTLTIEIFEHGTGGQSSRSHYVGSLSITTNSAGNANFNQSFTGAYAVGTFFSSTSTDVTAMGDRPTSEHSASVAAAQTVVIVTPTTGLIVNEGGSTATFSVSLSTAPTADVIFSLASSLTGEVVLSTNTITFTTVNWNIPQVITITGVQDFVSDGTKNVIIVTSNTTSTDANFNGLKVADIFVINSEIANIAPVIDAPSTYTIIEDTAANLGGVSTGLNLSDVDAGNGDLSVTVSVSNGVFSLGSQAGLSFSTGDGNADVTMTFQGTTSAINAAINAIAFTPLANFSGTANLTMTVNDLGNSGSGGPLSTTRVIPINVTPVNDLPVLAGTKTASVFEGASVLITAAMLNLTDIENPNSDLVFTIKAIGAEGELMLSGVSLRTGDSFTQADIDSQRIQYSHFGGELPNATITLGASERFGLQLADFDMQFSVVAVNDAPTITSIFGAAVSEISNIGMPVAMISAADADNASGLVFSLVNDSQGAFQINAATGAVTVLNPALIDYETATQHIIRVKVADSLGAAVEQDFVVQISDVVELVVPPIINSGSGTTVGGTSGTGGPTNGGGITTDSTFVNPGNGNLGATTTDTSNLLTSQGSLRSEPTSTTAANSELKRGSQTKQIEIDKEIWVDPSAPAVNTKKLTETTSKSVAHVLLEEQEAYLERNRYRSLNSDLLDLFLHNNRKEKVSSVAPPHVVLGEFKLPANAQSMPIAEGSIDNSRSNKTYSVVIDTIEYSGMALSVGAVAWATRTGGLLAALISAIPAWKGLDPLLVLSPSKAINKKDKEFEEFSDTELRGDEEAVRAVL
jgi:CSLREA domain-containing protein